jgi:hypothetical protein
VSRSVGAATNVAGVLKAGIFLYRLIADGSAFGAIT